MNKERETTALIEGAAEKLRALGLTVQAQKKTKPVIDADAWLRIARGAQATNYAVEVKRRMNRATLGAALARLQHLAAEAKQPALLVTDYVTPPMADIIREAGFEFLDAAGNAYLNRPGILLFHTGFKPQTKAAAFKPNQLFTNTALKILFALICKPELAAATQRELAQAANVALGAAPAVLAHMRGEGLLLGATAQKRRFRLTKRALDDWALGYARTLRPKTLLGVYDATGFDQWKEWKLDAHTRWGGEPAANLLVQYLKPGVLTLYTPKLPAKLMAAQRMTRARFPLEERVVEIRQPFWGKAIDAAAEANTVPPALVYADLLATGDARCIETAQLVYEKYLDRLIGD